MQNADTAHAGSGETLSEKRDARRSGKAGHAARTCGGKAQRSWQATRCRLGGNGACPFFEALHEFPALPRGNGCSADVDAGGDDHEYNKHKENALCKVVRDAGDNCRAHHTKDAGAVEREDVRAEV